MINIIYGLRDPRNDVHYYIGKSTVGNKRALSHLKTSHSDKINEWVADVRKNGFEPLVDIIEEVQDVNELAEREKFWVRFYFEQNPMLLNEQLKPRHVNLTVSVNERNELKLLDDTLPRLHILLKKARKVSKINQKEMAERAGISYGTLKRIESGEETVSICNYTKYVTSLSG